MRKIFTTMVLASMMMLAINVNAITPLPDQGVYKIKNVYSNTYVKLQSNYLADITALTPEDASDLLVWYGERDENGEALLTNLSGDGGDMIETLEFIKGLIQETLEYNNQPTWFLEEMFQLHLVPTGDADGSVFLCVDVPAIDNWDEIKSIILEAAGGQTAVTYYITHMVPGNRHYMGIDYDGSFGYRLQAGTEEGTDIKFLMERGTLTDGFCFIKTASTTAEAPYLRRVHSLTSTVDQATARNDASAVFELVLNDNKVTRLAVQGFDLAKLGTAIDGAYMVLCPTNTVGEKFVYDNYVLKLQLPDEGVTSTAVLNAAAEALGTDSEIYTALSNHSDWIKDRAAIYFVHSNNGGVNVATDANFAQYADYAKWKIEFIDNDVNYFAPAATAEANGKYYTTLYTAFPYSIKDANAVKAYRVMNVDENGVPELEAVEQSVIPGKAAVLLEMTTNDDANNILCPLSEDDVVPQGISLQRGPSGPLVTMLEGTLFDDDTPNDDTKMLTLQDGLIFAPNTTLDYMPANQAWVSKDINTAINSIKTDTRENDDTIYDLMGRKVTNPTHGIYIKGGKKVVL